jgi:hypothetical protein
MIEACEAYAPGWRGPPDPAVWPTLKVSMVAATTSTVPVSMDAERHQFNVSSGLRKPLQSKLDLGEMLVHQVSVFHARAALGVPAIAREFGEADNAVSPTSHALCTPVAKAGGAAGAAWAVRRDLG